MHVDTLEQRRLLVRHRPLKHRVLSERQTLSVSLQWPPRELSAMF